MSESSGNTLATSDSEVSGAQRLANVYVLGANWSSPEPPDSVRPDAEVVRQPSTADGSERLPRKTVAPVASSTTCVPDRTAGIERLMRDAQISAALIGLLLCRWL